METKGLIRPIIHFERFTNDRLAALTAAAGGSQNVNRPDEEVIDSLTRNMLAYTEQGLYRLMMLI